MEHINYYQLKYFLIDLFYENIIKEQYTVGQSADRCIVEFQDYIQKNDLNQLIVYASILAKAADCEKDSLKYFHNEIDIISQLSKTIDLSQALDEDEQDITLIKNNLSESN